MIALRSRSLLRAALRFLAVAALVRPVAALCAEDAPAMAAGVASAAATAAQAQENGIGIMVLPIVVALVVALLIEVFFLLRDTIPICCWWFVSTFGLVLIGKVIWISWCGSVPMDQLMLSPDSDGTMFRVSVAAFGLVIAGLAAAFIRFGIMMVLRSAPDFSQSRNRSIAVTAVRMLPMPFAVVMAAMLVLQIFRIFQH